RNSFQLQLGLGPLHLCQHGVQHRITDRFPGHGFLGKGTPCGEGQQQEARKLHLHPNHCWPPFPPAETLRSGGGKIGGRFNECPRFCTSISENSMAGATAATGTAPDSAPQIPSKTAALSPVIRIPFIAVNGVPTMSTPRTSSSGRPSA